MWIAENKACHVSALFVEWSVSDRLKIFLYRWAVSIAGTKQPPTEIIRGGEESYSNDFYLVRLKLSPSSREFRAKSLLPEGVEGIWFGQDHVGHEAVVPNWALPEMYFAWEHFYRSLFIDGVSAFRSVPLHRLRQIHQMARNLLPIRVQSQTFSSQRPDNHPAILLSRIC